MKRQTIVELRNIIERNENHYLTKDHLLTIEGYVSSDKSIAMQPSQGFETPNLRDCYFLRKPNKLN